MNDTTPRPGSTDERLDVALSRSIREDLERDPLSTRLFFVIGYLCGPRGDDEIRALTEYVKTGRSDQWPDLSA